MTKQAPQDDQYLRRILKGELTPETETTPPQPDERAKLARENGELCNYINSTAIYFNNELMAQSRMIQRENKALKDRMMDIENYLYKIHKLLRDFENKEHKSATTFPKGFRFISWDKLLKGKSVKVGNPYWIPLRKVMDEEFLGNFMYMYSFGGGKEAIHSYKHKITRKSLNLSDDMRAWSLYNTSESWAEIDLTEAIEDVMNDKD